MKVYYLPGDLIYKKEPDKALNKISEKIKSMSIIILNPVTSNKFKELIRKAQKFNEENIKAEIIELNELIGFQEIRSLEELIKPFNGNEKLEDKEIKFPRSVKCIRATKINRKKLKPVYYHIRSNC